MLSFGVDASALHKASSGEKGTWKAWKFYFRDTGFYVRIYAEN